jgi:hypothetical protein
MYITISKRNDIPKTPYPNVWTFHEIQYLFPCRIQPCGMSFYPAHNGIPSRIASLNCVQDRWQRKSLCQVGTRRCDMFGGGGIMKILHEYIARLVIVRIRVSLTQKNALRRRSSQFVKSIQRKFGVCINTKNSFWNNTARTGSWKYRLSVKP